MKYLMLLIALIFGSESFAQSFKAGDEVLARCGYSLYKAQIDFFIPATGEYSVTIKNDFPKSSELDPYGHNQDLMKYRTLSSVCRLNYQLLPYKKVNRIVVDKITFSMNEQVKARCGQKYSDAEIIDLTERGHAKVRYLTKDDGYICPDDYLNIRLGLIIKK